MFVGCARVGSGLKCVVKTRSVFLEMCSRALTSVMKFCYNLRNEKENLR